MMNGIEVIYESFRQHGDWDDQDVEVVTHVNGGKFWYQARIIVDWVDTEWVLDPDRLSRHWRVPNVRQSYGNRSERPLWQAWVPGEDFVLYNDNRPFWFVNLESGAECKKTRGDVAGR